MTSTFLQRVLTGWLVALAACSVSRADEVDGAVDADILLRGGTIVDGSGAEGVVGDLAIRDKRIVAVGKFRAGRVGRTLDCAGLIIAPGFIDLHTHSDDPIVAPATRGNVNYLTQGCTTVVTGNCGSGPVNVAAYFEKIDAAGAGTHVIHLLPHGSLRAQVMGRGNRAPTAEELVEMQRLADQAMRDGAWGMTTGLIYVPGTYAETAELIEIARIVAKHGGIYASHIRDEGTGLLDSIGEALRIGREAGLPVHISHFKATGREAWGTLRVAAETIDQARAAGQRVTADQYPYAASSTSLEATLLPAWSREGGHKELERRLQDAEQRTKIRAAIEQALAGKVRVQIASYAPRRDWVGKSLDEIAALEKREVADVVLEIESRGGARIVNFGMQEDEVRFAMQRPWVATASDGGARIPDGDQPHPRNFGTFSRKIGRYALH